LGNLIGGKVRSYNEEKCTQKKEAFSSNYAIQISNRKLIQRVGGKVK
jgi:hypothetical protein